MLTCSLQFMEQVRSGLELETELSEEEIMNRMPAVFTRPVRLTVGIIMVLFAAGITLLILQYTTAIEVSGIIIAVAVPLVGIGILVSELRQGKQESEPVKDHRTLLQAALEGIGWQITVLIGGIILLSYGYNGDWKEGSIELLQFLGGNFFGRILGVHLQRTVSWAVDNNKGGKALKYVRFILALTQSTCRKTSVYSCATHCGVVTLHRSSSSLCY